MTRQISTSAKPLGYYVTVPAHIEQSLGSYFQHLTRAEQFTLLATIAGFMAEHSNDDDAQYSLSDAYCDAPGCLGAEFSRLLEEIEQFPDGTILGLCQALVDNLLYTTVEEG
jgi:hypothetical protein